MKENLSITIVVATHKEYQMPVEKMYLPLHVGAEGKIDKSGKELDLGYLKDNTGDNISILNSNFCELTGLYWAWKNLNADYIGMVHYRRYFGIKRDRDPWKCLLSYLDIIPYLGKIKIFVPNKRKYYIETLYSHYSHTHYAIQLDETRKVIKEKYPDYLNVYDRVMKHRSGYMFNMMIMKHQYLNEYCEWLFDILFTLMKRVNMPELSVFQARFYGRISEIIFNVWIEYQLETGKIIKDEIKEIPCIYIEKVNHRKKAKAFMQAKFFHKKYEGSF